MHTGEAQGLPGWLFFLVRLRRLGGCAHELSGDEAENKLRILYAGSETDLTIKRLAKSFEALCQIADSSAPTVETLSEAEEPGPPEAPPESSETISPRASPTGLALSFRVCSTTSIS